MLVALIGGFVSFFKPTRTSLFLSAALALPCMCACQNMAIPVLPIPDKQVALEHPLRAEGLRVIQAGDPQFHSEVAQLLDKEVALEVAPLLKQGIVVCNDTGRYIWGFTVIYTYPGRRTANGLPLQHQLNVSPGGATDRSHLLGPGGCYLVTPVASIVAARTAHGARTLEISKQLDLGSTMAAFAADDASRGSQVSVAIDSIIYEDGRIVGPDLAGQQRRINEVVESESAFLSEINGLRGQQLHTTLLALAKGSTQDQKSRYTAGLAGAFLNVYETQGEEATVSMLQSMTGAKRFLGNTHVSGESR